MRPMPPMMGGPPGPPGMGGPPVMGGPQRGPPDQDDRPGPSADEPPNKKQKTEDNLIPEDVFLSKNKVRSIFNHSNN